MDKPTKAPRGDKCSYANTTNVHIANWLLKKGEFLLCDCRLASIGWHTENTPVGTPTCSQIPQAMSDCLNVQG